MQMILLSRFWSALVLILVIFQESQLCAAKTSPFWGKPQQVLQNGSDADVYNCPKFTSGLKVFPKWKGVIRSTNNNFTAYLAVVSGCDMFSFRLADMGCVTTESTLKIAYENQCIYATNGGFFQNPSKPFASKCIPNVIVDHTAVAVDNATLFTNFGIVNNTIVVGYPSDIYQNGTNSSAHHSTNSSAYRTLMSGAGWLVRNGKPYVTQSPGIDLNSTFVTEKAPRTGLGVFRNGSIALLVVDGIEASKVGLDLFEFAELFTYIEDMASAINLDGGGSTTAVYMGSVINKPTCLDFDYRCQRDIPSITCVTGPYKH